MSRLLGQLWGRDGVRSLRDWLRLTRWWDGLFASWAGVWKRPIRGQVRERRPRRVWLEVQPLESRVVPTGPVQVTNPGTHWNQDGDSVGLQVSASDQSGGTLTYSLSGQPPGTLAVNSSGLITGNIAWTADSTNPYMVTVTATDGPYSANQVFSWYVSYLSPVSVSNPGSMAETDGDWVYLPVSAYDQTGANLSYSLSGQPPGLSINSSGVISGNIASTADTGSPYLTTVTATDGPYSASASSKNLFA